MKKTYLSVGKRERIRNRLLERKFKPLEDANLAEQAKVAEAALDQQLTPPEWARIEDLPEGWMPTTITVKLRDPKASWDSHYEEVKLTHPRRVPQSLYGRILLAKDVDAALWSRWVDLEQGERDIKAQRDKTKRELDATLASYRTVEALVEGWPEVGPIVEEVIGVATPKALPAVAHLNEVLELPPEQAEAA